MDLQADRSANYISIQNLITFSEKSEGYCRAHNGHQCYWAMPAMRSYQTILWPSTEPLQIMPTHKRSYLICRCLTILMTTSSFINFSEVSLHGSYFGRGEYRNTLHSSKVLRYRFLPEHREHFVLTSHLAGKFQSWKWLLPKLQQDKRSLCKFISLYARSGGGLHKSAWLDIDQSLAVVVLLGTSFTTYYIHDILPTKRKRVPIQSDPAVILTSLPKLVLLFQRKGFEIEPTRLTRKRMKIFCLVRVSGKNLDGCSFRFQKLIKQLIDIWSSSAATCKSRTHKWSSRER